MFLSIRGYAQLDWEWLIALRHVRLGTLLESMKLNVGVNAIIRVAHPHIK
jgi:hypothetical protein